MKGKTKSSGNIFARIKTSLVVLPLLFSMFYYPFLYYILMIIVIHISHKEFYEIESKIIKQLFTDQFSDSTSSTLISSPLQTLIILLLPTLFFFFENSQFISTFIVLGMLIIYRMTSFITIYNLNSTKDFEIKEEVSNNNDRSYQTKMKNPMPKSLRETVGRETGPQTFPTQTSLTDENVINNPVKETTAANTTVSSSSTTDTVAKKVSTLTSTKNSFNKKYVTSKMLNACLVVICLDFIFIFIYALPLCYGICLHHLGVGFTYVSLVVVIAYSCDVGALFAGIRFGKTQFGAPITPSKTVEGIYGGIAFAVLNSILFKFIMNALSKKFFPNKYYMVFIAMEIGTSIFGDFFESFLKRCGETKDSGSLFPGHGGLLDRIDSITLGLPLCYYFVKSVLI